MIQSGRNKSTLSRLTVYHQRSLQGDQLLQWEERAARRRESVHTLMFSNTSGQWHDLLLPALDRSGCTAPALDRSEHAAPALDRSKCTAPAASNALASRSASDATVSGSTSAASPATAAVPPVTTSQAAPEAVVAVHAEWQRLPSVSAVSCLPFLWGMGIPERAGGPIGTPQAASSVMGRSDTAQAEAEVGFKDEERERKRVEGMVVSMQSSGLVADTGLLSTTAGVTGQQWDAPNCWPPLLCMWVDGLRMHGGDKGRTLARQLGQGYLRAVAASMDIEGCVWEKYSTGKVGETGRGGEYEPQVGFGWSNGVALHLAAACHLTM